MIRLLIYFQSQTDPWRLIMSEYMEKFALLPCLPLNYDSLYEIFGLKFAKNYLCITVNTFE